jgi:hypothetical protein
LGFYTVVGDPLAAAEVGRTFEVRSLFSKYQNVGEETISKYISSIPESLSEAVNEILKRLETGAADDFILNNRGKLQILIDKFHREAGTMTSGVTKKLKLLTDPKTQIFVSIHQPNLFAYGGVFKKIVLLQTLMMAVQERSSLNRFVNLFLIVDHDFMDDTYIRLAELPSIRHCDGRLELRMPVSESKRWQLVCNMPLPGRTILDHWRIQIYSWIKNSPSVYPKSDKSQMLDNFEHFWLKVEESYFRSRSFSDFNSFLMSRLVNTEWGYDTLFVRLSEMSTVFEDGFKYLISNFVKYSDALGKTENMFFRCGIDTGVSSTTYLNAPLWLHCQCGSKASARIYRDQQGSISLGGMCISCKKIIEVNLRFRHNDLAISKDMLRALSPRAIPILLLLSRDLGIICYASGTGGSVGYTVVGAIAFKELSVKMPVTVIWPAADVYHGLGQAEALELLPLSKEADIANYMHTLIQRELDYKKKIDPLIAERAHLIRTGKSIDSVLSNLFRLKQEQRRIRHLVKVAKKVKNAIETKPSIIDYAINFGVVNTEVLWRQNLLNNDSLAASLTMSL